MEIPVGLFNRELQGADDVDGVECLPGGAVEDLDQVVPEFPPFFWREYFEVPKSLIHFEFNDILVDWRI